MRKFSPKDLSRAKLRRIGSLAYQMISRRVKEHIPQLQKIKPYNEIYESAYYERCDGMEHWNAGTLKLGDTLAAFSYALGIGSFEELRGMVGFTGEQDVLECPARSLVS